MKRQILSVKDISELYGVHKSTIDRMYKRGEFVRKVATSPRRRGFWADDVEEWFKKRLEEAR